jgi:hypothetical protein
MRRLRTPFMSMPERVLQRYRYNPSQHKFHDTKNQHLQQPEQVPLEQKKNEAYYPTKKSS